MKVLIINQHSSNHGDEAAGTALYRALSNKPDFQLSVLYNTNKNLAATEFLKEYKNVKQYHSQSKRWFSRRGFRKLNIRLAFIMIPLLSNSFLKRFFNRSILKSLVKDLCLIKENDLIISAPSGPNIGDSYSDWAYLWKIYASVRLGKKVVIYSPSIGPLNKENYFKQTALYCLKNVNFLSVREPVTETYLNELKIKYFSSVDTVFLDDFKINRLPVELRYLIQHKYIVFVPNQLYRYFPEYYNIDPSVLDSLYQEILRTFENEDINIVLLPQLFGEQNDFNYFKTLLSDLPDSFQGRIFLVSDNYNSDIQRYIIANSEFVIGARYHSVVFSIKSETPFICLSYEHKMTGLLKKLKLTDRLIDINDYLNQNITKGSVIKQIYESYLRRDNFKIREANVFARENAVETFNAFLKAIN